MAISCSHAANHSCATCVVEKKWMWWQNVIQISSTDSNPLLVGCGITMEMTALAGW